MPQAFASDFGLRGPSTRPSSACALQRLAFDSLADNFRDLLISGLHFEGGQELTEWRSLGDRGELGFGVCLYLVDNLPSGKPFAIFRCKPAQSRCLCDRLSESAEHIAPRPA